MSLFTSSMLGMMSFSHCLRKESLSKLGSAFTISVSTSDISVFEKRPPENKYQQQRDHSVLQTQCLHLATKHFQYPQFPQCMATTWSFIVRHSFEADFRTKWQWELSEISITNETEHYLQSQWLCQSQLWKLWWRHCHFHHISSSSQRPL